MDRRELLKYFGIGTAITPVVGGEPIVQAAATLLSVPEIAPLEVPKFPDGHVPGKWEHRLKWNAHEAVWLTMWQIQNTPYTGAGTLSHILDRLPTETDKAVAAQVVQWFGTNCGHAFLWEVLQELNMAIVPAGRQPDLVQKVKSASVWGGHGQPKDSHSFQFRGRTITLRANELPEVSW